jgi:coenzyme F420-reducing hydrogenase gamma subunit
MYRVSQEVHVTCATCTHSVPKTRARVLGPPLAEKDHDLCYDCYMETLRKLVKRVAGSARGSVL